MASESKAERKPRCRIRWGCVSVGLLGLAPGLAAIGIELARNWQYGMASGGTVVAATYALDLTGARLERFNMARKKIKWLTLTRCQIIGGAGFQDAAIRHMFFLNEAEIWGEVTFVKAKFGSRVGFTDFTAHDPVDFTGAEFAVEPELENAVFPEGSKLPPGLG